MDVKEIPNGRVEKLVLIPQLWGARCLSQTIPLTRTGPWVHPRFVRTNRFCRDPSTPESPGSIFVGRGLKDARCRFLHVQNRRQRNRLRLPSPPRPERFINSPEGKETTSKHLSIRDKSKHFLVEHTNHSLVNTAHPRYRQPEPSSIVRPRIYQHHLLPTTLL